MATGADAHRVILRGGASAAAGYVVRFGARLLFLFLAARLFGVALFGAYSLAVAAVELAVAVGGIGMKRYLFRLLEERDSGRHPENVVFDAAILVTAASLVLALAMIAAVLAAPAGLIASNTAVGIVIVAPMVAGQALLDLFLAATRWKQKIRYEVAARSLVEPYVAIAAVAAAWFAGFTETGLLISYWAGTIAALAYAVWGVRRCYDGLRLRRYRPSLRRLRAMMRASAMPTLNDFGGALFSRLDLYMVGALLGEAPAGIYNMARQMRTPTRQVRQSFDGLLTPIIARTLAATGPRETGTATASAARMILAFQLFTLVGMVAIGRPVLDWLGPEFSAGYWAMLILVAAECVLGAFGVADLILLYRQPGLTLVIAAAGIAVSLVCAWLLIPALGLEGAALAVLAAVTTGALVRRHLLRERFGIVIPWAYSAGPVAAAAAGIAVALLIPAQAASPGWPYFAVALFAGLASYAIVLKAWLSLTGERLQLVKFTTG